MVLPIETWRIGAAYVTHKNAWSFGFKFDARASDNGIYTKNQLHTQVNVQ